MWNPKFHELLDLLIEMNARGEVSINTQPYDLDNSSASRCKKLESLMAERIESVTAYNKQVEKIRPK